MALLRSRCSVETAALRPEIALVAVSVWQIAPKQDPHRALDLLQVVRWVTVNE